MKKLNDILEDIFITKGWYPRIISLLFVFCIITILIFSVREIASLFTNSTQESEAGYIVCKTTENGFHYIIGDDGNATPEFKDEYYYTMFIDDNYIKFQIPYKVFMEYNLGDHLTVYRNYNSITKSYSNYEVEIYDINIPAVIVEE